MAAPPIPAANGSATATPSEEATIHNRRGRTLLAGFTAAHFTHHVSNSLLNPLLPLIRDGFALSYAQSGFLVSAFSLSLGLSNAPIGVLADRVGSRSVIVVGLVLTGLVSAALAFAGAYWQLVLLLVLMGLIAGSYHAPAAALLTRAFPTSQRGAAIGFHITGGHLSFFATPLVAAALVSATDTWRTPYLWLAFAPILSAALVWYLGPREPERARGGPDRLAVFRELWGVIRLIGPFVSASIVFQMAYAALNAFLSLWMVDARGLPREFAVAVFGLPQLVGVLGAPMAGHLSDRLGRRTVILIGMGGLGPAFWSLVVLPSELILVPLLLIGVFSSLRQTPTEVLVMDSAPPHRRATVLGGYYMLSQELGGLAAPLLGLLAVGLGIDLAFTASTLALTILSVLVVLVHRRL